MSTPSGSRFAVLSESDKEKLLIEKSSKNTKAATKYAINIFHEYCKERKGYVNDFVVDTQPAPVLDKLLESFYGEARNRNGEKYSVSSLKSIRSGLQRYNEPPLKRNFNIVGGEDFSASNSMFDAVCVDLKRCGNGNTVHKPVIHREDIARLNKYFSGWKTNSVIFIRKVWFDIMMYCCRRGREGLRELTKASYIVNTDGSGNKYISRSGSEVTKNHRNDQEDTSGGVIFEVKGSESCLVKSFQFYLQKLNAKSDALFQRPKDNFCPSDDIWFDTRPLGKNTLGQLMVSISKAADLSQVYTNYSIRATLITELSDAGCDSRQIKSISKHKCVQSVDSYTRDTSLPQKRKISEAFSNALIGNENNSVIQFENQSVKRSSSSTCTQGRELELHVADQDFLDDSFLLSPEVDRILNDISSEVNVNNSYLSESRNTVIPNISVSNVSGGVFNFYLK